MLRRVRLDAPGTQPRYRYRISYSGPTRRLEISISPVSKVIRWVAK